MFLNIKILKEEYLLLILYIIINIITIIKRHLSARVACDFGLAGRRYVSFDF